MIFRPALARAVASGRKTQTRRPVTNKPCRYKVGHDYAVQPGRGKEAIARLKVLDVREERVGDISHMDAKAEGFRNQAAFKAYWVELYDAKWIEQCEANRDGEPLAEFDLVERFNARHAHKLVTVITFELAQDTPRFLAPSGRGTSMPVDRDDLGNPKSVTDYTSSPARAMDELECVGEEWLARFSKDALGFCIGRQLARQKAYAEEKARQKSERGRSMRLPPYARRAA